MVFNWAALATLYIFKANAYQKYIYVNPCG